jgi:hypothetical protein
MMQLEVIVSENFLISASVIISFFSSASVIPRQPDLHRHLSPLRRDLMCATLEITNVAGPL